MTEQSKRPSCTCHEDRSAIRCPIHTQADYDAAERVRAQMHPCLPSLGERCGNCHRCTDPADRGSSHPG